MISLIFVISEEIEQGRHLVYATLDPKTGLLYMMYEMGRSLKNLYKSTIKSGFLLFLFFSVLFFILFNFLVIVDDREFNINEYMSFIGGGGLMIFILSFIVAFGYITIGNSLTSLSKLSEIIFEKLGFENQKDQDFYKKNLLDKMVYMLVSWDIERI
ncbi:putative type VI secretion system effector [Acinetobacter sp. NIPH 2699]|uniref:putative type VI secretion system effector n=1 Tax=Acinetobacter sp. NIPH 2699 TaxID=2923433 RepID=UPI003219C71E